MKIRVITAVAGIIAVAALVYGVLLQVLGLPEFNLLYAKLRQRFSRR